MDVRTAMLIAVVALVGAGCSGGNLTVERMPWSQVDLYCNQSQPVYPTEPKPFCKSKQPLLFDNANATFPVPILFDESGGAGSGYDRLYIDFDKDGDFLDDPVYKATRPDGAPQKVFGQDVVAYFENVHIVRNLRNKRFAHVQVALTSSRLADGSDPWRCTMIPQSWAVGKVKVAGKSIPVALIDRNWNDRVTDAAGLKLSEHPGRYPRGDYLLLGIDGEQDILPPTSSNGTGGSARGILTEYLVLDSGTYKVQVSQSDAGANLTLTPAEPATGKLKLPDRLVGARVLLIGTRTCVLLAKGDKEVTVPADTYYAPRVGNSTCKVEAGKSVEWQVSGTTRSVPPDDGRF